MIKGKLSFNKEIVFSLVIYFILSLLLLGKFGINTGGEAVKYINEANGLLQGKAFSNGVFSVPYIVYSLLLSCFLKFSVNFFFVGVLQIFLSALAAYAIYNLLIAALNNKRIAFIFFIAYLLCYPVQKWNYFLYTESLHISFVVIGLCSSSMFFINKNRRQLLISLLVLPLILFTRPVGVIFLMAVLPVLTLWLYRNGKKAGSLVLLLTGVGMVIALFNSPAVTYINPDSIRRMEIICQVPEVKDTGTYHEFNREGVGKAFSVIKNEIGIKNFFRNGLKKEIAFLGLYRPYYSWKNNLLLMLFCVFYPFAVIGICSKLPENFYYLKRVCVLYITITSVLIFFTCDEWSNRFVAPVFPFIILLAAGGAFKIFKNKQL